MEEGEDGRGGAVVVQPAGEAAGHAAADEEGDEGGFPAQRTCSFPPPSLPRGL